MADDRSYDDFVPTLSAYRALSDEMDRLRVHHEVRVTELLTTTTALVEEARAARRQAAASDALCYTLIRVIGDIGKLLPRNA